MTDWLITDPHSRQSAAAAVTKWSHKFRLSKSNHRATATYPESTAPSRSSQYFDLLSRLQGEKKSVRVSESLTPNRVCQLPNKFALLPMPDQQHQPTFCSSLELASNFAKPWPDQFYFCYCYTQQKIFRSPPIIPETYSTLFLPSET